VLLLERAQVFATDLRGQLGLRKLDATPNASLAEAVSDLEQG